MNQSDLGFGHPQAVY